MTLKVRREGAKKSNRWRNWEPRSCQKKLCSCCGSGGYIVTGSLVSWKQGENAELSTFLIERHFDSLPTGFDWNSAKTRQQGWCCKKQASVEIKQPGWGRSSKSGCLERLEKEKENIHTAITWTSEITRLHQRVLLAEDDPVLQALLKALSDAHPRRLLDPEAELLLLMRVIFLSDLKHRRRHIYSLIPADDIPSARSN